MSFLARSKDNAGDVGRAEDQQQSVDNEDFLFAGQIGVVPATTGGVIRQFVRKTAIADNSATEVFTITTTDETGSNDGGSYFVVIEGMATHGVGPTADTAVMGGQYLFGRALNGAGTPGTNSAVVEGAETAVAASTAGTKTITTVTFTVVETSEYIVSVRVTIDLAGTTVTTGTWHGMVTLYYMGFTTPPVVTSIG